MPAFPMGLEIFAEALEGLQIACCVFDNDDRVVRWNSSLLNYFPEHIGHITVGEPYRLSIYRFYAQRLLPDKLDQIDRYIDDALNSVDTLRPPYENQHLDSRFRVALVSLQGLGRVRVWTRLSADEQSTSSTPIANFSALATQTPQACFDKTVIKSSQQIIDRTASFKAKFLATASHDLRQPVHSLGLMLEMLDQSSSREVFDARIAAIKNCATTLSELLNGILDLSRFDLGVYHVTNTSVCIGSLLDEVRHTFSEEARKKGLILDVEDSTLKVLSDVQLLRRIVFNLVSNALKYTRHGRVRVHCEKMHGQITLNVSDQGIGISAKKLACILNVNLRLQPDRPSDEGLGVGLTVVKLAADMLGHALDANSVEGIGTTFRLTMTGTETAETADIDSHLNDALLVKPMVAAGLESHQALIMFIENDEYTLESMTELMKVWGYRVLSYVSPQQAVDSLRLLGVSPSLIISDMHLNNDMNGLSAIAAIRHANVEKIIPAMLLTGDLSSKLYDHAKAADVLVVHKPIRPSTFKTLLNELLAVENELLHEDLSTLSSRPTFRPTSKL